MLNKLSWPQRAWGLALAVGLGTSTTDRVLAIVVFNQ